MMIDGNQALETTDQLLYERTGKYLNDLEREVFLGSWQGYTYEKIYPLNPEYVEKDVGYKLWKKLSAVLGEKVTKKTLQGAIERALKPRVFISHRSQEPELSLAQQLYTALETQGYRAFMVREHQPLHLGMWSQIDAELARCDYLLLLLSLESATSELMIEELQRVRELQDSRPTGRPIVLPIRVCHLPTASLNHDLRNYLAGISYRQWDSPTDTYSLIQELLELLATSYRQRRGFQDLNAQADKMLEPNSGILNPIVVANPLLKSGAKPAMLPTPLPVAEPELPNGQVRLDSAFYIDRHPYESQCYQEIQQAGALIRIKAPRQMGKTSLMARILYQAREQGYRTVPLSFQHADKIVFENLNQLLRWLCTRVSRKLKLRDQVDEYWSETYGSKDNCTEYFEDYLLTEANSPLVLGLDEVDRVFQYPNIADDFFGLLRAWYEEAGYGNEDSNRWQNLRLVVVHSTEVYIPIDINQSPFNVGLPIELPEFTASQVEDLTHRHGLDWQRNQIEQLMDLVGGHPYLIRVALYNLVRQQLTLEKFLKTAATESGPYDDHLRRHLWSLQQHPDLGDAFHQVLAANQPIELPSLQAFKLHSMGLVKFQGNQVVPRFSLYRRYFNNLLN